jgi:pyridoxal phosphate enzyme (YggS family)
MATDPVRANLEHVRERIARAAERAGRRASDVLLIGVSKTIDADRIRPALDAGLAALGENRVQEAKAKVPVLGRTVAWHLIGHLQTNKVKDALELFDVIQSLDRLPLAEELERRAAAAGRDVQVLVEVNLAAEPPKSGVLPDALPQMLDQVAALPHLRVRGLMAIPPMGTPDDARPWFRSLRKLGETHGLAELSMGMSADYETAIEEGATMVRVGTAIFGARTARA